MQHVNMTIVFTPLLTSARPHTYPCYIPNPKAATSKPSTFGSSQVPKFWHREPCAFVGFLFCRSSCLTAEPLRVLWVSDLGQIPYDLMTPHRGRKLELGTGLIRGGGGGAGVKAPYSQPCQPETPDTPATQPQILTPRNPPNPKLQSHGCTVCRLPPRLCHFQTQDFMSLSYMSSKLSTEAVAASFVQLYCSSEREKGPKSEAYREP